MEGRKKLELFDIWSSSHFYVVEKKVCILRSDCKPRKLRSFELCGNSCTKRQAGWPLCGESSAGRAHKRQACGSFWFYPALPRIPNSAQPYAIRRRIQGMVPGSFPGQPPPQSIPRVRAASPGSDHPTSLFDLP